MEAQQEGQDNGICWTADTGPNTLRLVFKPNITGQATDADLKSLTKAFALSFITCLSRIFD